jgi:uncharacterized membrane protein
MLSDAMTLTNKKLLFLIMVIKSTKLYDPEAYGSVSILPTRFFYQVILRPLTLKNNRTLPLIVVIKTTKLNDPEANCLVSILPTRFFYKVMK